MPHLVVHCSRSVLELTEPTALMRSVFDAASSTGLFEAAGVGGIKVRLEPYDHYLNVDAHEHFVHVFAYIMQGRTQPQKRALTETVVASLCELLPSVDIISMNVLDFERATYGNRRSLCGEGHEGA